ncbi:helix-turn-helix transcriptional regulator [Microbacterium sp. cx-59]|uniref:helix-turn-helix domain-containing protein n=1 Tax=Microbacterium sp. cx-59 TaxID=2891207 RepID=UPI001E48BDF8|nr:helix-turn-helix transcriptional regulator [Microbacterium sp. cx-59]MCC4908135.1 hypothetical protein [Microbacterium sp. cx-59]
MDDGTSETFDDIAGDLQALRADAGHVSYAEIARRIAERRQAAGMPASAARLARSTVYDVFRPGRARISATLVGEIAAVLGEGDAAVDRWVARCRAARARAERPTTTADTDAVTVTGAGTDTRRPLSRGRFVVAVLAASALVNLIAITLEPSLHLPLYLDMIGTSVAAIALGPWFGVLVAVITNLSGAAVGNPDAAPFVLVNIAGALVWGYGARLGLARTVPRFFALNLLVAVTCTLVAVPLLMLMFEGGAGHSADTLMHRILGLSGAMVWSVFVSNLMVSVPDKLIAGFVALAVVDGVQRRWRVSIPVEVPTSASTPPR